MSSSLFQRVFGCCFGRAASPEPETQPLIPDDELDPYLPHDIAVQPRPPVRDDAAVLEELLREAESKMVRVQDPHPFVLQPPTLGHHETPSSSRSRSSSPNRSHEPESASERSHSLSANTLVMRPPVLNMRFISRRDSPFNTAGGKGRGRDRVRARDGSSMEPLPDPDLPKVATLSASDQALLSNLSADVRRALKNGFQIQDVGKVVHLWDDV
ncbi:hypothetical protein FRC03_003948 [Tulasnella sp. 419]|nr:hypothetical protein FRC02_002530 [Tulasnella sp. 418]KAG8962634.1 hypothetical protein FRC03_003948 [Tulasnella sp. 419]